MIDDLLISTDGHLGRISLNRPAAINALSLGMIEGIKETLRRWSADDGIGAIVFEGIGPKGFCAGGDVRAARSLVIGGQPEQADAYFASEYEMNRMIATYAKPLVALGHGITMGGGFGIAGHCRFRFTQPGARFAMPESAIGFFGDVGVSAILAKAPLNRALLFMMSGVSVGAADALALGLADAVIAPEQVADLRADLVGAAAAADPAAAIGRLMEANSVVAGEAPFCALADLLPAEPAKTPAEFVAAVAAMPALADIAALFPTRSPGSLVATFFAQHAARRLMDVTQTLAMDLRLARVMARRPDFAEGVRAVLVDKDQAPKWSPASLAELDPERDAGPILEAVKAP
jgi:enoyl-CoA hydratase